MYLLELEFLLLLFGYVPRNRIAGSYGRFVFSVLRNLHTAFHIGCTDLYFHFSPHPLRHLLLINFFDSSHLVRCEVISHWISLIISGFEHLFKCQLAICISSLEKYLFSSSFYFLNWVVCFLMLNCMMYIYIYIYIYDINPILVTSCANIFPPFIRLYFHFVDGFLCFEKAFKFN